MQDLNDKITGNRLTANEWNEVPSEIQNVIEALGQTLTSGDLNQLGKSIASYVANGTFYTDSGATDAYVLSVVGSKQGATAYTNGFEISFITANTNTGASTINVAGLGVKSLKTIGGGAVPAGYIVVGEVINARYDGTDFILSNPLSNLIIPFDALNDAVASTIISVGNQTRLKEHSTGNGGGGDWDIIAGTGTANGINIVAHDTLSFSLVLRITPEMVDAQFGIVPDGVTDQTLKYDLIKTLTELKQLTITDGITFFSGSYDVEGLPRLKATQGASFSISNTIGIKYRDLKLLNDLDILIRSKSKTTTYPGNLTDDYLLHATVDTTKYDTLTAIDFNSGPVATSLNLNDSSLDLTPATSPTITADKVTLDNVFASPDLSGVSFDVDIGSYYELSFFTDSQPSSGNMNLYMHDGANNYVGVRVNTRLDSFSTFDHQIDIVSGSSGGQVKEISVDAINRLYNFATGVSILVGLDVVSATRVDCYVNHAFFGSFDLPDGKSVEKIFAGAGSSFSSSTSSIDNLVKYTNRSQGSSPQTKSLAFFGDSLTFGSTNNKPWPTLIRSAAERLPGVGTLKFDDADNFAVSGATAATQLTIMQATNLTVYDIVIVMLGTNEAAQDISPATYKSNLELMLVEINAANAKMIVGTHPMFGASGGSRSGLIWSTLQKFAAENTVTVADPLSTLSDEFDWMVGDEIHPNVHGSARIASAFGEAIRQEINTPKQAKKVNLDTAYQFGVNSFTSGPSLPTSGARTTGDFHSNTNITFIGGTHYLKGWLRITTGTGHVLNTDWAEEKVIP
jgi:lysophospholipase L1-like esterase